jgi:hypothetical protein
MENSQCAFLRQCIVLLGSPLSASLLLVCHLPPPSIVFYSFFFVCFFVFLFWFFVFVFVIFYLNFIFGSIPRFVQLYKFGVIQILCTSILNF